MSTIIYPSPIFGPIHSRRLGISLGINLLPSDGKHCTFDCIYCECGFNADFRAHQPLPTRQEVSKALEEKLKEMKEYGPIPDVLTFAGNGEPTSHPHFSEIMDDTLALRNKYFPEAKVSVLSNATLISSEKVRKALSKVDNNILKLDTVNMDYILEVDRPVGKYSIENIVDNLKKFKGHVIIQTIFMKGISPTGKNVDNTTPNYVQPWLQALKAIQPEKVMIYTIDRETPAQGLLKVSHEELDGIAALVQKENIVVSVSY